METCDCKEYIQEAKQIMEFLRPDTLDAAETELCLSIMEDVGKAGPVSKTDVQFLRRLRDRQLRDEQARSI